MAVPPTSVFCSSNFLQGSGVRHNLVESCPSLYLHGLFDTGLFLVYFHLPPLDNHDVVVNKAVTCFLLCFKLHKRIPLSYLDRANPAGHLACILHVLGKGVPVQVIDPNHLSVLFRLNEIISLALAGLFDVLLRQSLYIKQLI